MLAKRILVSLALLPVGMAAIILGEWVFTGVVMLVLGLAAWEYYQLFQAGGLEPAGILLVGGTVLFAAGRGVNDFESAPWILSLLVLGSMAYHLFTFEAGHDHAATDFAVTLSGPLYLGWIGAYLISLRALPDGMGWVLLALPAVWAADSGAYMVGVRWGRHKLSPHLSPKKSWEGYLGGVAAGTLFGGFVGYAFQQWVMPGASLSLERGLLLGFILAALTVLGDLGESMVKRQVGVKDSGTLLPGHGGVFDRIDSWLWAGVISYYVVTWFFL